LDDFKIKRFNGYILSWRNDIQFTYLRLIYYWILIKFEVSNIKKMVTVADRKKIAEWVLNTKDEVLLDKIKVLALSDSGAIQGFINEYNREIDEAIERVSSGKYSTHEEVETLLNSWENK